MNCYQQKQTGVLAWRGRLQLRRSVRNEYTGEQTLSWGMLLTNCSSGANDTLHGLREGGELFPGLLGFSFCYPGGRVIFVTIYNPSCWSKTTAHTTPLLHNRKIEGNYFFFLHALCQKNGKEPGGGTRGM